MKAFLGAVALSVVAPGSSIPASAQEALIQAEALRVTPDRPTGIYKVGERIGWTFAATGKAAQRFSYVVRENNSGSVQTGELDLTSGSGKIETRLDRPGMVLVRLSPVKPEIGLGRTVRDKLTVGAAVAPDRIRPGEPAPADFDTFWGGKLKAQAAIPMNAVETPISAPQLGIDMSIVTFDALGSKAHGYLAKPSGPGKHPALIIYQYAGVYKLPQNVSAARAKQGWLVLNIQAHDMAPDEKTAPANYFLSGNTNRETSYFLGMYLRASRAVDYIRSRPEWDGRTVVLTGTSQGGQQSLVAAGLNPGEVSAVAVMVPAGADITGDRFGRRQGFPTWQSKDPAVVETGRYFDVINFASRIKSPTIAAIGMLDIVAPPAGVFAAFSRIRAPKEAVLMVDADHGLNQADGNRRIDTVLNELRISGRMTANKNWAKTQELR